MLPAETFEMRKFLLTLSLAKPSHNAEAILKTYELLVYGDTLQTNSFLKKCVKIHRRLGCDLHFLYIFPIIISIVSLHTVYRQIHR
jgi:hypothetical protein